MLDLTLCLEDSVADFEVGDGTRFPLLSLPVGRVAEVVRFWHPAIALAEDADKERLDPVIHCRQYSQESECRPALPVCRTPSCKPAHPTA